MARNRPRKGTEMMRGAGSIPAPLIAGLTMFPVTFGSDKGPGVAEDVFQPFAFDVLSDPGPVMAPARRAKNQINGATVTRQVAFDASPLLAGLYMSRVAPAPAVASRVTVEDFRPFNMDALTARKAVAARAPQLRRFPKRRLAIAASTLFSLFAVSSLVTGASLALFSASSPSQFSTLTAGTVAVGLGTGTAVQCNVTNQAPGDASTGYPSGTGVANQLSAQCTYFVTYTGNVPAYLALDVAVTNGTAKLYDGTTTGLQLLVKDASTTFIGSGVGAGGTNYTAQGGSPFAATLASPGAASDMLVSTSTQTNTFTDEFTIDYNLPIPSNNANIGGSSTVTLTFHAVQAGNNALPGTCTAAGTSCTGLSWS